jgi:hypothetical protein
LPSEVKPFDLRKFLLNFAIELIIYGTLVTLYYLLALRFLSSPLEILFEEYIIVYAIVSLILIVIQGMLLESFTHFLLNRIGIERFL